MEVKERKEVTEFKMVTIARKCDVCGIEHKGKYTPDEWHEFSHSHNEWGNDSIDSVENHEVCSPKCYWEKFKDCVHDLKGRNNAEIDGFDIHFARLLIENL
jgi:hypothetical protein